MSIWKRLTGRFRRGSSELPDTNGVGPVTAPSDGGAGGPGADAEAYLRDLIASPDRADTAEAHRAVQELRRVGRELVAVDLIHRLLTLRPTDHDLRALCADLLLARVDDATAKPLLEELAEAPGHAARATFLLGDLHERAGDLEGALRWYERVLARDVEYPNARERVGRLTGLLRPVEPGAATPTLLSPDGAMARGRYRLLRELGRGGAGTVYLALDVGIGREVALKVYHPDATGEARRNGRTRIHSAGARGPQRPKVVWGGSSGGSGGAGGPPGGATSQGGPGRRFLLEARTAAMLRHPGIIRILDVDEALHAIVMERIAGGTLASLTRGDAKLTEARVLEVIRLVLEPLALVHRRGIVHRDLKPSNLLRRETGEVVISDFGVALVPGDTQGLKEQVGTYAFMPPEVRKGACATPASDVYAVGKLLAELRARAPDATDASARLAAQLAAEDAAARPRDATEALRLL